jgi:hypothetical protein
VCGYSNRFPTLTNPGNQSSAVGQSVSLQLQGSDPEGQPVSYTATGLPAGLSLMSSTGYIAGAGTTAGTFSVTAKVSDGVLTTQQVFTWAMTAAGVDTTPPSISIVTPAIGEGGYTSTTSSISMTGTSSDNVGVSQVTWTNSLGGSGTATGTTSWSGSIPLKGGTNIITITARDAAGNTANAARSVTYTAPAVDTTAPVISIATPTSASSYTSSTASIAIGGTSSDNVGVTQVTWVNSLGGSGTASGTTSWSAGAIALQGGTNVITVKARDAAGNIGTAVLSVAYTPPVQSTPVVLTGQLVAGKWRKYAQLSWTSAPWEGVSVYRNGVRIGRGANDGSYSDSLRYPGSYTYKVCNSPGTTCTNTVTLYY